MKKTTEKQKRFLRFVQDFSNENGYPPSVREIAHGLGLSSTSAVQSMIDRLSSKGLLSREAGAARTLSLSSSGSFNQNENYGIPILGRIKAGLPVMTEENIEGYVPVKDFLDTSSGGFFLIVEGYSMQDKGILPGDYAFIKPQKEISNGQIGAFRINGEVTLKIFKKIDGFIELHPANTEFEPIIITPEDDFDVIGRFVMLLRLIEKGYDRRLL